MKHKKSRHESTSEESNNSDESVESESSSESSVSEDSSVDDRRHKRKRKKDTSSASESQSELETKPKKRKHKKKKKKHGKRKKQYEEGSESGETHSEKEIPKKKKKHKHGKHSKRSKSSANGDEYYEDDKRGSSYDNDKHVSPEQDSPQQTYYRNEYQRSRSPEYVQREKEVQRFYRGSSKDKLSHRQTEYHSKDHASSRYQYEKSCESYYSHQKSGPESQSHKNYDEMRRPNKYDDRYHHEEHHRQPREYHRGDPRDNSSHGPPHYKYQDRGPRKHYEHREYEERRPGPPAERYSHRDYPEKRERYRDEPPPPQDRERDYRRSKPVRSERPPHHREHRERSLSRSRGSHHRDRREGSAPRTSTNRDEHRPRERKSRFAEVKESDYEWGKKEIKQEDVKGDKEKPNFGLSGKLTEDANTVNGVVIKYTEPDDAKQPKRRWRFYPFKGDKALPILYIHRQSCFIMGRDKKVVDIHLEHPSVSKQHAALQYRATPFTRADGSQGRRVRPYVIDLDSANGTFVNNKKIDPRRYVELLEKDVVKFGFSQREYVLLHENSKDDAQDDDNEPEGIGASVTTTAQIKQEKRAKLEKAEDGD